MKKIYKIASITRLFFLLWNTINSSYAAEEWIIEDDNIISWEQTLWNNEENDISSWEQTLWDDEEDNQESTEEKKEFVVTKEMVENWPYKHELTHINIKMIHKPAWMYMIDNKKSCENWWIYYILNDKWAKIKKNTMNCKVVFDDDKKNETVVNEIFKGIETNENEEENIDLNSASEEENIIQEDNINVEEENNTEEWDTEVDDFIDDILWYNSSNKLKNVILNKENFFLSWKQLHQSIKNFSQNKNTIVFNQIQIKGLKWKDYYNSSIATLFDNFKEKVSINKYRNQFAKNLSDLSFSFSSYNDENLDNESKELFRKKLVNDMKKVQVWYTDLQKKEDKLYKFFFNKG